MVPLGPDSDEPASSSTGPEEVTIAGQKWEVHEVPGTGGLDLEEIAEMELPRCRMDAVEHQMKEAQRKEKQDRENRGYQEDQTPPPASGWTEIAQGWKAPRELTMEETRFTEMEKAKNRHSRIERSRSSNLWVNLEIIKIILRYLKNTLQQIALPKFSTPCPLLIS